MAADPIDAMARQWLATPAVKTLLDRGRYEAAPPRARAQAHLLRSAVEGDLDTIVARVECVVSRGSWSTEARDLIEALIDLAYLQEPGVPEDEMRTLSAARTRRALLSYVQQAEVNRDG